MLAAAESDFEPNFGRREGEQSDAVNRRRRAYLKSWQRIPDKLGVMTP
jgi:hypothetical protein